MPGEWLTTVEASILFDVPEDTIKALAVRHGLKPVAFMGRPVNPSALGRPVFAFARAEIERALESDAAERLAPT